MTFSTPVSPTSPLKRLTCPKCQQTLVYANDEGRYVGCSNCGNVIVDESVPLK